MCMILLAHEAHPRLKLVLAANRDEFYERPTAPAAFWTDNPELLAGRDLRGGGTWLGVTLGGRIAAVTNYRSPGSHREDACSRGGIVRDFLLGSEEPEEFLSTLERSGHRYNGFSLLVGDPSGLWFYSNRSDAAATVAPGFHGLSNHLLDTPWPKVETGKRRLREALAESDDLQERLLGLMTDRRPAEDRLLPDTGVGLARERALSPLFICTAGYGTRSTTVVLIDRDGHVTFVERTHPAKGGSGPTVSYGFAIRTAQ